MLEKSRQPIKFSTIEKIFYSVIGGTLVVYLFFGFTSRIHKQFYKYDIVCVKEICIDNQMYNKCETFPRPRLMKVEKIKTVDKHSYIYNFVDLGKECDLREKK